MPVIGTNVSANTALTFLNRNSNSQSESLSKLSSGSRIVIASDDAAGLAVASRLRSDISTFDQGARNAIQAQALLRTADGALAEIGSIIQRMASLAAQSLSGSLTGDGTPGNLGERLFLQVEFVQLQNEIDGIVRSTTFNGDDLLNGTYNEFFLVGAEVDPLAPGGGDYLQVNLFPVNASTGALNIDNSIGIGTVNNAQTSLPRLLTAINDISSFRSTVGSLTSRAEYRGAYITTAMENLNAAQSAIMDVDIAAEQTALVSNQVLTETSLAALSQAHQMEQSLLSIVR